MSQLLPGNTIGIIGGSPQISSVVIAAKQQGYRVCCYHQEGEGEFRVADEETIAPYDDRLALLSFSKKVDSLLLMTNLVEIDLLYAISGAALYFQSFELAEISQVGLVEKLFLENHAINVSPYGLTTSVGELLSTLSSIGFPALLMPNRIDRVSSERIMLYDHDMEERVLELVESSPCIVSAFVPAKRHFSVSVVRDYEDQVIILPITEDVYVGEVLKYSLATTLMNPEWESELKKIARKIIDTLSGSVLVSIQVILANNDVFYVTKVDQIPFVYHQFGRHQLQHSMSDIMIRLATGLPILSNKLKKECVLVPIYESILERAKVLHVLKPSWDFEYFYSSTNDIRGVIRLNGDSIVELLNDLEISGIHDELVSKSNFKV